MRIRGQEAVALNLDVDVVFEGQAMASFNDRYKLPPRISESIRPELDTLIGGKVFG